MRRQTALAVDTSAALPNDLPVYELTQSPRSSTYTTATVDLKTSPPPSPPPVQRDALPALKPSVFLLFSPISTRERWLVLLPAVLSSVISGGIAPFMTIVIGRSFDAFAKFPLSNPSQSDKDQLLLSVGMVALELVGLAVGALALSSITSSLWIWTGEHNVMALRKMVYKAVTSKDMVWFDTKLGAEGNVQSAEGDKGPLGAGGLMAKFAKCVFLS
jgi:ATP-binding cassette, subfamily B (MDR/TAP), member 1